MIQIGDHGPVSVTHDDESDTRVSSQEPLGPGTLALGGSGDGLFALSVVAQGRAQPIHQTKAQLRVKQPINRRCAGVLDEPVNELCLPSRFG